MEILMTILLVLGAFSLLIGLALEWATHTVYGGLVSEDFLDKFLTKNWETYRKNGSDGRELIYGLDIPYIGGNGYAITSKWSISNIGRIPRWSKWHKEVNQLSEKLNAAYIEKFL